MRKMIAVQLAMALSYGAVALGAGNGHCVFGDNLDSLARNRQFTIKRDVIHTFKLSRIPGDSDRLLLVAVDLVRNKEGGRLYQINRTFMDKYDGGNTIGWIEAVTDDENEFNTKAGSVVAEIQDSQFANCKVP